MWLHPIILLGFLLIASTCAQDERAAVAFVDVKFDDKAAIWSLLLNPRYEKVIAITSGVFAHDQAAYELKRYLVAQNEITPARFSLDKIHIFQGTSPLPGPAPHEGLWHGQPGEEMEVADWDALRRELQGYKVAVFQIAPTTPEQVRTVIAAADRDSIETYFLLHGYNSRQVDMATQTQFLHRLRSWLVNKHQFAEFYVSSSFDSYPEKNGGKQFLGSVAHMFPQHDLEQALRDPFWSSQLLRAHTQGYTPIPFRLRDGTKPSEEELAALIYNARTQPDAYRQLREDIVKYITEKVLPRYQHVRKPPRVIHRLKYTHIPEFEGPTTIELADANHIAAFHRFLEHGDASGMTAKNVVYPRGPHEEGATVNFVDARGPAYHAKMLQGADTARDLEYLTRLAGYIP